MPFMIKLTLTLLLLCIFSSCGSLNIEKRKHTKGFYLCSATTNQKVEKTFTTTLSEGKDKIENSSFALTEEKIISKSEIIDSTISDKSKFCDTIVLRNGAILSVHILEKTDSTLMYSLCEGDDDSEVIIPIENVKLIRYKEGKFEVLNQKNDPSKNRYVKPKKNINDVSKKEDYTLIRILSIFIGSLALTILAGLLLVLAYLGTSGIFFAFLVFLIVALSFYLFLKLVNRKKSKYYLLAAFLFGLPFAIISYFLIG